MKAQSLPNEILLKIFNQVPRPTIYQCLFVCKAWKTAALGQFYQQVTFNGKMITKLKSILRPKKRMTKRAVTHGELVKRLKFSQDKHRELTQDELSRLLSYIPYLKKVDFTSSYHEKAYLDSLFNILDDRNNNIGRSSISDIGHLDYLEDVCCVGSVDLIMAHLKVCYAARDTLKCLSLHRYSVIPSVSSQRTGTLLSFLVRFKNLTHLSLGAPFPRIVDNPILPLKSIFQACPNLKCFELSSIYPLPIYSAIEEEERSSESNSNQKQLLQQDSEDNRDYYLCRQLKSLSLSVPYITNMGQFVDFIPIQRLNTLKLHLDQPSFLEWVQECDTKTIAKLGDSLSLIKDIDITFWGGVLVRSNSADPTTDAFINKVMNYQQFISHISQRRQLVCNLDLTVSDNAQIVIGGTSKITVRNGKMYIKLQLLYKQDTFISNLRSILGGTTYYENTTGEKTANNPRMSFIQSVTMYLHNCRSLRGDQANRIVSSTLHCINSSCPYITDICIKESSSARRCLLYSFTPALFNFLNEDTCFLSPGELETFLDKTTPTALCFTRSTLQGFLMSSSSPSSPVLPKIISNYSQYNDIKYLDLKRYKCSTSIGGDQIHSNSFESLDLSKFLNLYQFDFDVSRINLERYHDVFFKITFTISKNKKAKAYYKCTANRDLCIFSLAPTSWVEMNDNIKLQSTHTLFITFNFSTIDVFSIYHTFPQSDSGGHKQQEITLRASVSVLDDILGPRRVEEQVDGFFSTSMAEY